jgi:hypothetical protein
MSILTYATTQPVIVIESDGIEMAFNWGKEDSLNSQPRRPSKWFCFRSPAYDAYDAGYMAGVQFRVRLTGQPETVELNYGSVLIVPVGMPADFAGALVDGTSYVKPRIDWAAVENEPIGD